MSLDDKPKELKPKGTAHFFAVYPRKVPVLPGMPSGWHGMERLYGPNSKYAGQVYCRYYSDDGSHRHVCSPKQVIVAHCELNGGDPAAMIAEFQRLQKERAQAKTDLARQEREKRGVLKGEMREQAIERFREAFGPLSGPVVFNFTGWLTRWHYQPNCDQVMVEYLDPEGNSWKLLKDLECAFQHKIDQSQGTEIGAMIDMAKEAADPIKFAEGSKKAREAQGVFEMSPETGQSRVMSQEDRLALRKQQDELKKATSGEGGPRKKHKAAHVHFATDPVPQADWAVLESKADVTKGLEFFRDVLALRGFKRVDCVAVFGVKPERKWARRLQGVYYRMPEQLEGQNCYQKLLHCPNAREEVGCDCMYIAYSTMFGRWEIASTLKEVRAAIAHSEPSKVPLDKVKGPWQVQDGLGEFHEDSLTIMTGDDDGDAAAVELVAAPEDAKRAAGE